MCLITSCSWVHCLHLIPASCPDDRSKLAQFPWPLLDIYHNYFIFLFSDDEKPKASTPFVKIRILSWFKYETLSKWSEMSMGLSCSNNIEYYWYNSFEGKRVCWQYILLITNSSISMVVTKKHLLNQKYRDTLICDPKRR